ncbi:hypothetical protein TRVL_09296 [Trypanosoma vivax]|nr:hypothetical protein TRVL_09296 [Trypanosoma vivax]
MLNGAAQASDVMFLVTLLHGGARRCDPLEWPVFTWCLPRQGGNARLHSDASALLAVCPGPKCRCHVTFACPACSVCRHLSPSPSTGCCTSCHCRHHILQPAVRASVGW